MIPQEIVSLSFTEDMHGFCIQPESPSFPVQDLETYQFAYQQGEALGQALKFRLTITIDDIESSLSAPHRKVEG